MPDSPAVRSARGHVAHHERLIAQWTERRDEGDAVPGAETLTGWIRQAERDLAGWRSALERALEADRVAAMESPPPA